MKQKGIKKRAERENQHQVYSFRFVSNNFVSLARAKEKKTILVAAIHLIVWFIVCFLCAHLHLNVCTLATFSRPLSFLHGH